jgi:hypothetical protein
MWVNGASVAQATSNATPATETSVEVGREAFGGSNPLTGYISGLRIVTGSAVYDPASSTITVPTAPLTAITNTSLLLNFTNAGVLDATAKNDLETVGNAQISTAQSKWGGASIAFDGSGDFLACPDNTALEPGGSNLTWEMWINTTSSTQFATLYSRWPSASPVTGQWTVMINYASATAGDVAVFFGDFSAGVPLLATSGANIRDGAWHHIAIVRNGSAWTAYIDGVSRATGTWSGTVADVSGGPYIGRDQTNIRDFAGYIDDLRVTKGVARYTANFTAPTAAFPLY